MIALSQPSLTLTILFKKNLRRFLTSDNFVASKPVNLVKRAYVASCNLNYDPATNGELALVKRLADLKCVFDVEQMTVLGLAMFMKPLQHL